MCIIHSKDKQASITMGIHRLGGEDLFQWEIDPIKLSTTTEAESQVELNWVKTTQGICTTSKRNQTIMKLVGADTLMMID